MSASTSARRSVTRRAQRPLISLRMPSHATCSRPRRSPPASSATVQTTRTCTTACAWPTARSPRHWFPSCAAQPVPFAQQPLVHSCATAAAPLTVLHRLPAGHRSLRHRLRSCRARGLAAVWKSLRPPHRALLRGDRVHQRRTRLLFGRALLALRCGEQLHDCRPSDALHRPGRLLGRHVFEPAQHRWLLCRGVHAAGALWPRLCLGPPFGAAGWLLRRPAHRPP